MSLLVRQEQPADYDVVYQVVRAAFATAEQSDGNEQDLIVALRNSGAFVPGLSLVAECDGVIVGHILFTRVSVGREVELALAPLSVLPAYQGRGIGQALMARGHEAARRLGYDYSVVLGHPRYYPKAGYVPASEYGIKAPFDVPNESFMALKLNPDAANLDGSVEYDPAFGV